MADKRKQKRSGLRGMFGMMKTMRRCMSGKDGGYGCAAMMGGFEGLDCSAMMKAVSGSGGAKSEPASAKA